MGNMQDGKLDWSDLVFTSDPDEIQRYRLSNGDVLFNRTNTVELVGKCSIFISKRPAIFAGYLIRINCDASKLDSRYLTYVMNTEFARKHSVKVLSVAVGQANINGQKVKTYPIPVPPTLAEQKAIASALSDADASIESLEQLLAKKRLIKQAAMQELLTCRRRLPGFGEDWKEKCIGDFAVCYSGGTPSTAVADYYGGDIPWITSSDLNRRYIHQVDGRISKPGFENSAAKMVEPNTLLIALYGATAGVPAISRISAAINQAVLAIVPKSGSVEFLFFQLSRMRDWLISTYTQGGQPNLSGQIIKDLKISLPNLTEQRAISQHLSDMDLEIRAVQNRLTKVRHLKHAMMQQLLTGRIRLQASQA